MEIKKHPHIKHARSKAIVTFDNEQERQCFNRYTYGSGSVRTHIRRNLDHWTMPFTDQYPQDREVPFSVVGHVAFVAAARNHPSRDPENNIAANEILRATTSFLQERADYIPTQPIPPMFRRHLHPVPDEISPN